MTGSPSQADPAEFAGSTIPDLQITVDSGDVLQQLKAIECRLAEVVTHSVASGAGDPKTARSETEQELYCSLQRQSELLHALTEGLEQFEDRLTNRLVEVVRETAPSVCGCESAPTAETSVESSTETAASSSVEEPSALVDESWDAIRRAMMESADKEFSETTEEESADAARTVEEDVEAPTRGSESGGYIEPVEFEIPEAIDVAAIGESTLRDAVLARDDIIRVMAVRLRQRIELAAPISTEQLRELADELPDEFRDRVSNTLALLNGQLRLTELELSLERARLGRQMSQLEESQAAIRSTARQLGCTVLEDGTLEGSVPTTENSRGRRWMRVLGFGR